MPKIPLFRKRKFGWTTTYKDIKESANKSSPTDQEVVKVWNEEHPISDEDCKGFLIQDQPHSFGLNSINLIPRPAQSTTQDAIYSAATLQGMI